MDDFAGYMLSEDGFAGERLRSLPNQTTQRELFLPCAQLHCPASGGDGVCPCPHSPARASRPAAGGTQRALTRNKCLLRFKRKNSPAILRF